ncbi:hypothetical protein FH972_022917 [Carpinus fangiana]|uniref:Zinc finger Sec23/Sec24-type domain-containing protein n=1 Tax=Carpinus fangiana TaxID=176857 RepID=A0A5N6KTY4_9ROSI|nr:hypothetical protein FH972_022917 [Carpinus fangiana]
MSFQSPYTPGQGQQNPNAQFQPPAGSSPYQQQTSAYGAPTSNQYGGTPQAGAPASGYFPGQPQGQDVAGLTQQIGGMGIGGEPSGSARGHKKKDRHAYHNLDSSASHPSSQSAPGLPGQAPAASPYAAQQWGQQQQPGTSGFQAQPAPATLQQPGMQQPGPARMSTPLQGTAASTAQGRVDPEQIPSIPWSRDAPAEFYLSHVYPTMEQHLPPPASVPFVAIDQGNSTPKYARLTLNSIPATSDSLASTALPLGLLLQPLAPRKEGEQEVPVIDFGDVGPPRCRRCRTYINPFMVFRSGGNKFVCNMCTFPNDVAPEYYAPTDPSGARVDRMQRPELSYGTVEFTAPKEYWTREPVPLRTLFLIDVSAESISKGFLDSFCAGILETIYGDEAATEEEADGETNGAAKSKLAAGARVGFATYDKEVQFYNVKAGLEKPQMVVMPDLEDPFVPLSEGMFGDPIESRTAITHLLKQLPHMFSKVKGTEPALLPALRAGLDALKTTGGKVVCSLAALPTWGPGRLFLREKPELRDTEAEKKLFTTEHPGYTKVAKEMTENGIGADFFLAAPQGGYLDVATIGFVSEKTGGEVFYYPNFYTPRDTLKLSKEIKHVLTRESGFQALMKVRCSNGLQVSGYHGNFTQHTFGADLEFGVIDSDKAFGASFSYDGKLDSKLDAHFQSALLYTTATGQRRIRCSNVVASVSDGAMESMKFVDQDAVVSLLAKQACGQMPQKSLKDVRANLTEKTIDILAAYRKNFSGSHPPGQLVLPEHLKEFAMYMLGVLKTRALKAGAEPTDRRAYDMRLIKSMGAMELSLFLYPRIYAIHSLGELDGFANESGHLVMPAAIRASYSRVEEGGAYIVDCGQITLLWLHAHVSPNLLEDLFGEGMNSLKVLNPTMSALPVLQTHLNAQVRNILQFLEDNRGSKALTIQLARQGIDGAEFEFARLLFEDRNNEAQSYVDWLVHVHRHIQLELQGQRKKEEQESTLAGLTGLKAHNTMAAHRRGALTKQSALGTRASASNLAGEETRRFLLPIFRQHNPHNAYQEDPNAEAPRSRLSRSRPHRQAPQAPRWSRYGRWHAPPPDQLGPIPSRLLRQGRHALLPQAAEPLLEARRQPRQAVVPRPPRAARKVPRPRRQEGRHRARARPAAPRLQQGAGQGPRPGDPADRQGALLLQGGGAQDQGGWRRRPAGGIDWQTKKLAFMGFD